MSGRKIYGIPLLLAVKCQCLKTMSFLLLQKTKFFFLNCSWNSSLRGLTPEGTFTFWRECYKTFFSSSLTLRRNKLERLSPQVFLLACIVLAGKDRAGHCKVLPSNRLREHPQTLDHNDLSETNTLAPLAQPSVMKQKKFYNIYTTSLSPLSLPSLPYLSPLTHPLSVTLLSLCLSPTTLIKLTKNNAEWLKEEGEELERSSFF